MRDIIADILCTVIVILCTPLGWGGMLFLAILIAAIKS